MCRYAKCTDEELIARLRSGEAEISDYLMEKYKGFVRKKARTMFLIGGETDILDQYVSSYMQNSEQSLLLKELEEEIMSYINTLPPQCHKIFMLSRSYGLKNREIAEQLNISIKAVEKQISKALSGLKEYLIQRDLFPLLVLAVTCLSL